MENIQIKEEIQEKILPSSTVEETCIAYIMKEVKHESQGKGKAKFTTKTTFQHYSWYFIL